jgi:exopolysaccharide biosynthesis polyprenyl glycosylphosphotransferase
MANPGTSLPTAASTRARDPRTPLPTNLGSATRPRGRDATRHRAFALLSSLSLILTDVGALLLAFTAAFRLRDLTEVLGPRHAPPAGTYWLIVGIATGTVLLVFSVSGLYRARRAVSRMDEFYKISTHISLGLVVAVAASSFALGDEFVYSRQMLVYGWGFAIVAVTIGRFVHTAIIGALRARGVAADRLLIVGAGTTGRIVLDKVRTSPHLGYQVVGFARHSSPDEASPAAPTVQTAPTAPTEIDGVPVLGMTDDLADLVRTYQVDELIVALSGIPHEEILDLVYAVTDEPVAIRLYPDTFRLLTSDTLTVADLNGLPTVNVRTIGLRPVDRAIKRAVDVAISATILVASAPLLLLIALLIKLTSRGPVFYVQERVGQDGRAIQVLKFRTMRVDAEADTGPVWATPNDPRRTRVGRLLRRYSLDELPQFINVLLGEMSVVGPRPERPYFVEQFSQTIPAYMARHHEKSGITGWAQVNGLRGDTSIEERTRYDLYYVENWSILFDIRIMAKTLLHIFRDKNAY